MKIYRHIQDLKAHLSGVKGLVALVPTMGNLHDGHLGLVDIARRHADVVVVSIFVNPTQFGAGEDFDAYPRTLDMDAQKLAAFDGVIVFAPSVDELYPSAPNIRIDFGARAQILCAKNRPTHFGGVGLIVAKLFNIVRPDVAIFGQKDYQQLVLIRALNDELNFGIKIIAAPTHRADDGLALSSRNQYLSDHERAIAPTIYQNLIKIKQAILNGNGKNALARAKDNLTAAGFAVDYMECYTQDLTQKTQNAPCVVLVAARLGNTRLIDNIKVDVC